MKQINLKKFSKFFLPSLSILLIIVFSQCGGLVKLTIPTDAYLDTENTWLMPNKNEFRQHTFNQDVFPPYKIQWRKKYKSVITDHPLAVDDADERSAGVRFADGVLVGYGWCCAAAGTPSRASRKTRGGRSASRGAAARERCHLDRDPDPSHRCDHRTRGLGSVLDHPQAPFPEAQGIRHIRRIIQNQRHRSILTGAA